MFLKIFLNTLTSQSMFCENNHQNYTQPLNESDIYNILRQIRANAQFLGEGAVSRKSTD